MCEFLNQSNFTQTFHEHPLFFKIVKSPERWIISSDPVSHCFNLEIDINHKTANLHHLLLPETWETCLKIPGLGTWLLQLVDTINSCLGVQVCKLHNAASFETK